MAQVIINPEEAKRFASLLQHSSETLGSRKTAVNEAFLALKGKWRDERYTRFARTFEESIRDLDQFLRLANNYVIHLQRKAQKAEKYLRGSI